MLEIRIYKKNWYKSLKSPKKIVKKIVNLLLKEFKLHQYNPTISIVLADKCLLRELNFNYNKKDYSTNVLSFQYSKDLLLNCHLGEIIISLENIVEEAKDYNLSVKHHFSHILIHGLLHILGYDHQNSEDEEKMQEFECLLLEKLRISNPYLNN